MNTLGIDLGAPFGLQLSAAAEFYAGFAPMGGAAQRRDEQLQLVFRLDGTFEAVSVIALQHGARLRLDVDGYAWAAVGEADPALGAAKRQFPGFFTAGFPSPYEAGVGGVLSHRTSVKRAAAVRRTLSEAHGEEVGGLFVLPSPAQLLDVKAFPGIATKKLEVLHGLARAAVDGTLDAERLRTLSTEFALRQLEQLHGVGPWTANCQFTVAGCMKYLFFALLPACLGGADCRSRSAPVSAARTSALM